MCFFHVIPNSGIRVCTWILMLVWLLFDAYIFGCKFGNQSWNFSACIYLCISVDFERFNQSLTYPFWYYMADFAIKIKSFRCVNCYVFAMWYLTVVSESVHEFWCSFDCLLMHTYVVWTWLKQSWNFSAYIYVCVFGKEHSDFGSFKVIKSHI